MKIKIFAILILISLTFGCISEDAEQTVQEIVQEVELVEQDEVQPAEETHPEIMENTQIKTFSTNRISLISAITFPESVK